MPGFDRTGPAGDGPMTGGGRGLCGTGEGVGRRNYGGRMGRGWRCRGFGPGRGAGRGWGASPIPAGGASAPEMSAADELAMLKAESERIQQNLEALQKRMAALEKPGIDTA